MNLWHQICVICPEQFCDIGTQAKYNVAFEILDLNVALGGTYRNGNGRKADRGLVEQKSAFVRNLYGELDKVIVGQRYMLERMLVALLANGHLLLEGVPGLAKTMP